jgi:zinc-ribbon domain
VTCPACGRDNPAGSRFCHACGASLAAAGVPAEPSTTSAAGWRPPGAVLLEAFRRGGLVFGVVLAAGVLLGLASLPVAGEGTSAVDAVLTGGVALLLFHHAAIEIRTPALDPMAIRLTVSLALMLGTAAVAWLLFLAGRAVAARPSGWGAAAGALVAIPYALGCVAVALVVRIGAPAAPLLAFTQSPPALRPVPLSALAWSLGFGLLFGLLGAMRGRRAREDPGRASRLLRAAVAGGWRMAWMGLALSFVGLLVLAGVNPDATRSYFDGAFAGGAARGVAVVVLTALSAPNLATGVLSASMGAPIRLELLTGSCTVLSYARFPEDPGAFPAGACGGDFAVAPAGYFLFLVVPVVATLAGGRRAAGLAGGDRGLASLAGGAAGLAFGGMVLGLMALARVTVEASGSLVSLGSSSFGPQLLLGWLLASAWGATGGALGGLLGAGREAGPGGPGPAGDSSVLPLTGRSGERSEER